MSPWLYVTRYRRRIRRLPAAVTPITVSSWWAAVHAQRPNWWAKAKAKHAADERVPR